MSWYKNNRHSKKWICLPFNNNKNKVEWMKISRKKCMVHNKCQNKDIDLAVGQNLRIKS